MKSTMQCPVCDETLDLPLSYEATTDRDANGVPVLTFAIDGTAVREHASTVHGVTLGDAAA